MSDTRRRWPVIVEWVAFAAVVLCFLRVGYLTFAGRYLPQPFYYMPDDTFMDWFNTAWWAREDGVYDTWRTVYPPLSFVILKLSGLPYCYAEATIGYTRQCDWLGLAVMHAIFILNIILTARLFLKIDRRTALQRSFALSTGMPMLFGLERGNLAILCYTFVLLGFGPVLRSAKLRWLFVGLAVNLKVYVIGAVAAQLLRRRWRWFEGALLAVILVYLVSFAIYGKGTPKEIYDNLVNFAVGFQPDAVTGAYYVNTYNALRYALTDPFVPAHMVLGSYWTAIGGFLVVAVLTFTKLSIVAGALATWLRPEVVPPYRITMFGLAFAMVFQETGPYTAPMLLLFVFMEPWKGFARPIAIISAYVLSLPGDFYITYFASLYRYSYFFDEYVIADQNIALGMFVRPMFFSAIPVSLAFLTIRDVVRDVRSQGWSGRWRFRNDRPILPGLIRPTRDAPTSRQ